MGIKSWLETALANESLADFSVEVVGKSKKGDGFMGDIEFVDVQGTTKDGLLRSYNLVLKYSKTSEAMRSKTPIKYSFENEIYFYSKVLPAFRKFQESKGVADDITRNIPKYYGHCITDVNEILVLGNVKARGYELNDVHQPLTRRHLDLVLEQYAKFHAISAAFGDQYSQDFETLTSGIINMFDKFDECMDVSRIYGPIMREAYDLLKDELPEDTCERWLNLVDRIPFVMSHLLFDDPSFKVVSHGDSWNNNFMFKYEKNQSMPTEAMLLDWQMLGYFSPVRDLSYFMYSCISKDDLADFDDILKHYHQHFSSCVQKLGSDPEKIYPFNQFLTDWKKFSCVSLIFAPLFAKVAATERNEQIDLAEVAEQGDITEAFCYPVKNQRKFKERIKHIIEHAAERQFI